MSHIKIPRQPCLTEAPNAGFELDELGRLDTDTEQLLRMASLLGPRDLAALSQIIRRTGEICESDGEEIALAVLDQIRAILDDRGPDA